MTQAVMAFFRVSELEARLLLNDREVFEWLQERYQDLSWGSAW